MREFTRPGTLSSTAAAHYGWGEDTDDEIGPQPGDYEDGMSEYGESEEQGEEEKDRAVDPPAATGSSTTGLGSSTDRTHTSGVGGKGKAGGKSMPYEE